MLDVARGGRSFDLEAALAPGRITVVDFWAVWCRPCKAIDKVLRELAHKYPLAVRRAEVTTMDSPIAQAHLKGVKGLPVVWVYNQQGQRVLTLVGAKP